MCERPLRLFCLHEACFAPLHFTCCCKQHLLPFSCLLFHTCIPLRKGCIIKLLASHSTKLQHFFLPIAFHIIHSQKWQGVAVEWLLGGLACRNTLLWVKSLSTLMFPLTLGEQTDLCANNEKKCHRWCHKWSPCNLSVQCTIGNEILLSLYESYTLLNSRENIGWLEKYIAPNAQ